MSNDEVQALNDSNLDKGTPFAIAGVSHSQLSIARHYGGCKFQGRHYLYLPQTDELLRDDVVKWLAKHRKAQQRTPTCRKAEQGALI